MFLVECIAGGCCDFAKEDCLTEICKEGFERELPADYHRNMKLEQEDANKVRLGQMSRKEFIRNMNNGKYR